MAIQGHILSLLTYLLTTSVSGRVPGYLSYYPAGTRVKNYPDTAALATNDWRNAEMRRLKPGDTAVYRHVLRFLTSWQWVRIWHAPFIPRDAATQSARGITTASRPSVRMRNIDVFLIVWKSLFDTWAAQNSKIQKHKNNNQSKQTGKQTQIKIQSK